MLRALKLTNEEAVTALDDLREGWRQLHDRGADMMAGLLTFVSHHSASRQLRPATASSWSHISRSGISLSTRESSRTRTPYTGTSTYHSKRCAHIFAVPIEPATSNSLSMMTGG